MSREHGLSGGDAWRSLQTRLFILALLLSVTALRTLEKDSEPSIYSLAYQTILILGSPKLQQTSRWRRLRALCCWCC